VRRKPDARRAPEWLFANPGPSRLTTWLGVNFEGSGNTFGLRNGAGQGLLPGAARKHPHGRTPRTGTTIMATRITTRTIPTRLGPIRIKITTTTTTRTIRGR
jgi:hypothetical protein